MEDYKKLKKELHHLLLEGDNLLDDDKAFLDSMIDSLDSQGILGIVRDLKEDGNCWFKQRRIEEALEKYGYAGTILAKYDFVDANDMIECVRLAISILLNSAACFGKKSDFEQMGRICTIVLECEPENVKALYRRAMASIGLGKSIWAYWDLYAAAKLDPKNQEVSIKLKEVKHSLNMEDSDHNLQNDGPIGLGMSLDKPRKKSLIPPKQDDSGVLQEMKTAVSIMKTLTSMDNSSERDDQPLNKDVKNNKDKKEKVKHEKHETMNVLKETEEEAREEKDIKMMDVEQESKFHSSNPLTSNLAESTYRFSNRRRPGSSVFISRKNYQMIKAGKTIHCWNSKLGSWMSIRIISGSTGRERHHNEDAAECMEGVAMVDGPQQCELEMQEGHTQLDITTNKEQFDSTERIAETESLSEIPGNKEVVTEDGQPNPLEGGSLLVGDQSCNGTKNVVKVVRQVRYRKIARTIRKDQLKRRTAKRNLARKDRSPVSLASFLIGFQHQVGLKRKNLPDTDYTHRPKKKSLFTSSVSSSSPMVTVESGSESMYQSSVSSSHECTLFSRLTHEMVADHY